MSKRKPVKKLIGIVFFILVFVFACTVFFLDLHLTPLNAAKKNNYIHKNAVLLKEINAREYKIYIFQDNDQSYKTVISKPFGPFWKSEIAFNYQSNLKNDIETVGYAKINDQTINVLMLAFKTNTNDIKYVEAGPDGERFLRPMLYFAIEKCREMQLKMQRFATHLIPFRQCVGQSIALAMKRDDMGVMN